MKRPKKSPDTNRPRKSRGIIGALLIIGLILIISLFFVIPIYAHAPVIKPVGTYTPQWTPTPLFTPRPGAKPTRPPPPPLYAPGIKPPACTFPLAQTTTTESAPENYTFSEPQEPLPPNDAFAEIVDWLPDNQRVLLVEEFDDTNTAQQKIELFNPQTGEIQVYATREPMSQPNQLPAWVAGLDAVIYPETRLLKSTHKNGMNLPPYEFERQLWVSRGDPQSAELLEDAHLTGDRLSSFSVSVKPGGSQIVYRAENDKQFSKKDASLTAEQSVTFDPSRWDYRAPSNPLPLTFNMAWRPGSSQIFLYNYGVGTMGYTFLLDASTGEVCELNFGGWAFFGRWSPDGRYLAIVRNQEPSFPANSTDLAVLDATTGKLYTMGVTSQEIVGRHYISGIAWAPDNYHLLVLGSVMSYPGCAPDCHEDTRLYLVDFLAGQINLLLPSDQFTANNPGTNLAWSPDGSKVLALCPNLCLISVQRTGQ